MRRIGLTGWEIFSNLDAVKWTLNQAEDISQRVFRLLKGRSIPESNQRGKRNKNHMNPLIQLEKATLLFVITLVLAWFALSPQAFAAPKPTFTPSSYSGCNQSVNVAIRSGTPGGRIFVKSKSHFLYWDNGGTWISNPQTISVNFGTGWKKLKARHAHGDPAIFDSDWGYSYTYKYCCHCLLVKVVSWGIGGILLVAVLIWLFRKRSSASR